METLHYLFDLFVHLDRHLNASADALGAMLYLVLFLIVFCETGLVVTPILPGDSLLFAVGALAAYNPATDFAQKFVFPTACGGDSLLLAQSIGGLAAFSPIKTAIRLEWIIPLLIVAAIAGDATNYFIGYRIGPKIFQSERSRLLNKKHLLEAQSFYEKYGAITIIIARFMPIIRTFAPFVAGIGKMEYRKFSVYNVVGGIAWVLAFTLGGYFLGSQPLVQQNFSYVIVAIVIISIMPAVIKYLLERRKRTTDQRVPVEHGATP
jgi:membrane-associated protein